MNFLPILQRELLVQARRPAMHWTRLALAGFFALLVVQHFLGAMLPDPALAGRYAFDGAMALGFVLACGACLLTVDALSGERREGTLGLLLLTPMTVTSVVLGKLASAGLTVLLALLGLVPALMLPVLAGGVTPGEAARTGLALLAIALLALAVGLWASAGGWDRRQSVRRAAWLMAGLVLGTLLAGWAARVVGVLKFVPGPLDALAAADVAYVLAPGRYWWNLGALLCATATCVWLAQRRLRRQAGDETALPGATDRAKAALILGSGNPLAWRISRGGALQTRLWWAAVLIALGGSTTLAQLLLRAGTSVGVSSMIYFAGNWGSTALAAWAASRFFSEASRSGELELLRTTLLGACGLIPAHRQVFARLLRGPIALVAGWVVLRLVMFLFSQRLGIGFGGLSTVLYLLVMPLLVEPLHLWLAVQLGTVFALRLRRQAAAVLWTVALMQVLPLLIGFATRLAVLPLLGGPSQGAMGGGQMAAMVLVMFVSHPVLLIALAIWARRELNRLARLEGATNEPMPSPARLWGGAVSSFRRARHWTPERSPLDGNEGDGRT